MSNWLEVNKAALEKHFGLDVEDDFRGDVNLARREVSKQIVFIVRLLDAEEYSEVKYYGFDDFKEAFDILLTDMVANAYDNPDPTERFRIVDKESVIVGTLFQGREIKFHPITCEVAILIKDPRVEGNEPTRLFDCLAGTIPYVNLEVIKDERETSEETENASEEDDGGTERQGELFDSEEGQEPVRSGEDTIHS